MPSEQPLQVNKLYYALTVETLSFGRGLCGYLLLVMRVQMEMIG